MKILIRPLLIVGSFGWLLSSCANAPAPSPVVAAPMMEELSGVVTAGNRGAEAASKKSRSGIATGWGREVGSPMTYTDFKRASDKPIHLTTIRYNDKEGAKQMGVDLSTKGSGLQKAAGGLIEWGMASGWGTLNNYWWRGGRFVIGKKGREYELKVRNLSNVRLEAVMSVDGLDVIDGTSASIKKRGYIVNPGQTVVVKGFRTSSNAVASFKFSSVSSSYANLKHGDTRNVGVIGLALFSEKGSRPWADPNQRGNARPFAEAPNIRARD